MQLVTITKRNLGEPHAHVMMRHAKTILRWMMILALLATALLFVYFRPAAYLAALPVPVLLLAFIFVSYLERQSSAKMLRSANQTNISQVELDMNRRYAGIYTAMGLALLFAIATFIVAATLAKEWSMVGLIAAVLFLMSIMIIFPYIPLFVSDAAREEQEYLQSDTKLRDKQ